MSTATLPEDIIANLGPSAARAVARHLEEKYAQGNRRSADEVSERREKLKTMDDAELEAEDPKVKVIVGLVMRVRKDKPDEKMIVASHVDAFLDHFTETLEREFRKDEAARCAVGRFDKDAAGAQTPRNELSQRLNDRADDLGILLVNALDDGWWGFTLTGASTLFLCDPVWTQARYNRLVGMIRRLGQTRHCEVFECVGPDSGAHYVRILRERGAMDI